MTKSTFTEQVQALALQIPKGKVITYGNLAKKAGSPGAARAVGSIMAKNYINEIPCHRVIPASGGVGRYNRSGGTKLKEKMLIKEGIDLQNLKKHYWN